jgi:hypothetical protein
MFEFLTVLLVLVFALTVLSGVGSAFLRAKYGNDPSVAPIAGAFATVYLAGSSVIIGPLRALGSRDKQLDESSTTLQLPPPEKKQQ